MSYLGQTVPPFYTYWGLASATTPGVLTPGTQTLGGNKTWVVPHTDSAAETLAGWRLDEDTSSILEFLNASATNAKFIPMIRGTQSGTDEALHIRGAGTTDTGTTPIVVFGARIGASTNVATRPLFVWRNNGTDESMMLAGGGQWWGAAPNQIAAGSYLLGPRFTTTTTTGSLTSIETEIFANPSGSSSATYSSAYGYVSSSSGNAQNFTATVGLAAFRAQAQHRGSGTVTGLAGLLVDAPANTGGGTVTNAYGVYINTPTVGTSNYGLYVNGGTSFIGGTLNTGAGRIRKVRVALTTPVTVATTDDIVQTKLTTPAAVTVNLPASPEAGRQYVIQDATGDAGANNITITPAAGNINGAGTKVMNTNYQQITVTYDSSATAQWLAG